MPMCLLVAQYGLCLLLPMCVLLAACRSSGELRVPAATGGAGIGGSPREQRCSFHPGRSLHLTDLSDRSRNACSRPQIPVLTEGPASNNEFPLQRHCMHCVDAGFTALMAKRMICCTVSAHPKQRHGSIDVAWLGRLWML